MTLQNRATDPAPGKRYFRSDDRVFRQSDGWYYSAREGDLGPYRDEAAARAAITRFVREQMSVMKARTGKSPGGLEFKLNPEGARSRPGISAPRDIWRGRPDVD